MKLTHSQKQNLINYTAELTKEQAVPLWCPTRPGEILSGVISKHSQLKSGKKLVVANSADKPIAAIVLNNFLADELREQSATIGDLIGICYLGSYKGQPDYSLKIVKAIDFEPYFIEENKRIEQANRAYEKARQVELNTV